MKKIHVDEILKKKEENLPGPDRYEKVNFFGGKQGALEGSNHQYSMRKKLGAFERHLDREKKRPGPGHYQNPDLVGKGLSTSTMQNSIKSSIPKSEDRFRVNKFQLQTPPPN